jgi:hypothetical protein
MHNNAILLASLKDVVKKNNETRSIIVVNGSSMITSTWDAMINLKGYSLISCSRKALSCFKKVELALKQETLAFHTPSFLLKKKHT